MEKWYKLNSYSVKKRNFLSHRQINELVLKNSTRKLCRQAYRYSGNSTWRKRFNVRNPHKTLSLTLLHFVQMCIFVWKCWLQLKTDLRSIPKEIFSCSVECVLIGVYSVGKKGWVVLPVLFATAEWRCFFVSAVFGESPFRWPFLLLINGLVRVYFVRRLTIIYGRLFFKLIIFM